MSILGKVIRILFGLSESEESLLRKREQFFHDEIVKAYDAHDYERARFLNQIREG